MIPIGAIIAAVAANQNNIIRRKREERERQERERRDKEKKDREKNGG